MGIMAIGHIMERLVWEAFKVKNIPGNLLDIFLGRTLPKTRLGHLKSQDLSQSG